MDLRFRTGADRLEQASSLDQNPIPGKFDHGAALPDLHQADTGLYQLTLAVALAIDQHESIDRLFSVKMDCQIEFGKFCTLDLRHFPWPDEQIPGRLFSRPGSLCRRFGRLRCQGDRKSVV